jgi:hypothetical protein
MCLRHQGAFSYPAAGEYGTTLGRTSNRAVDPMGALVSRAAKLASGGGNMAPGFAALAAATARVALTLALGATEATWLMPARPRPSLAAPTTSRAWQPGPTSAVTAAFPKPAVLTRLVPGPTPLPGADPHIGSWLPGCWVPGSSSSSANSPSSTGTANMTYPAHPAAVAYAGDSATPVMGVVNTRDTNGIAGGSCRKSIVERPLSQRPCWRTARRPERPHYGEHPNRNRFIC